MDFSNLGEVARQWLAGLPQTKFYEVRAARERAGNDIEAQRRLSYEDRRAFARELTRDEGVPAAVGLALQIPAEQAVKAAGQYIPGLRNHMGRSGFHDPMGQIGAGYVGMLQGLADRWQ